MPELDFLKKKKVTSLPGVARHPKERGAKQHHQHQRTFARGRFIQSRKLKFVQ